MKYEQENAEIDLSLAEYAMAIINNHPDKNKWAKETKEIFIRNFISNEISFGRTSAVTNLNDSLKCCYR